MSRPGSVLGSSVHIRGPYGRHVRRVIVPFHAVVKLGLYSVHKATKRGARSLPGPLMCSLAVCVSSLGQGAAVIGRISQLCTLGEFVRGDPKVQGCSPRAFSCTQS